MPSLVRIESRQNPALKDALKLRTKRARQKKQRLLLEGFRLLEEALKAGVALDTVFLEEGKTEDFQRYVAPHMGAQTVYVGPPALLGALGGTEHPQGVYGVFHLPEPPPLPTDPQGVHLYLDGVQDPGNLGTIIRSAHAAGAASILIGEGTADPYSDKVLRAAMGSFFHIPVHTAGDAVLEKLLAQGIPLVVTVLEGAKSLYEAELPSSLVLAIGNEGRGVREALVARSALRLKIPMPGGAESLNAAVAASIVLFEGVRQRQSRSSR